MSRLAERYRSARRDPELVVLEGLHPLKHALRFGADLLDVRAADPEAVAELARALAPDLAAALAGLPGAAERTDLGPLVPRPPATGVVALARRPRVVGAALLGSPGPGPVVLLERPTHLGNLGAVVRVAAAAGAAGVLCLGPHDPWAPDAVRGGAGLQFALPVARIDALPRTDGPRALVGMDPSAGPWREPLDRRSVLAFGSERRGLSAGLLGQCDQRIALPMRAGVSSLNLATSVAATLYLVVAGVVPVEAVGG